jgi:hypothetical protein
MKLDMFPRRTDAKILLRVLAFAAMLSWPGAGHAQQPDCAAMRAALAAPARQDPAAVAGAAKLRNDLDQLGAYAHSIGCDNQQFLFFGQAPPPQCGGIKQRLAGMRSQYEALRARAGGDGGRRALLARYNAACGQAPAREKNFFETIFGGGGSNQAQPDQGFAPPAPAAAPAGEPEEDNGRHGGGSQALCVRTCDGGFFPLSFSARSASPDELLDLCKSLCPNAEVQLFTKNPEREISTAVSPQGEAYSDLPNALKYTRALVPDCGCKPPRQTWVEALAHAEELLNDMGGAKATDATITEEQSRAMAKPLAAKPGKGGTVTGAIAAPPVVSPLIQKPQAKSAPAPDGAPRQIRVVGPQF